MSTADFYDALEPFYHLIYSDWSASIERQGEALTKLIRERWPAARTILDATCGIGTQTLGLTARGFEVTASDVSPRSVDRLTREAGLRGLSIDASVCDIADLHQHHGRQFDLVLSADNALPHLKPETELPRAIEQMFHSTRPGGGCLFSVRDYASETVQGRQVRPYGVHQVGTKSVVLLQIWDCQPDYYDVVFYVIEDDGLAPPRCHRMRDRYFPIKTDRLLTLMSNAGYRDVQRVDGVFFQPVLIGTRPG